MDLVTCCIVLCSVDSTFTNVCILFRVFIVVTKMFILRYVPDTVVSRVHNIMNLFVYMYNFGLIIL